MPIVNVKKDRYPEIMECFIQTDDDRRERRIAVMVTIVPADTPGVIEKDFTPATVHEQNEIKQNRGHLSTVIYSGGSPGKNPLITCNINRFD